MFTTQYLWLCAGGKKRKKIGKACTRKGYGARALERNDFGSLLPQYVSSYINFDASMKTKKPISL
jgi:hypothetical protein